ISFMASVGLRVSQNTTPRPGGAKDRRGTDATPAKARCCAWGRVGDLPHVKKRSWQPLTGAGGQTTKRTMRGLAGRAAGVRAKEDSHDLAEDCGPCPGGKRPGGGPCPVRGHARVGAAGEAVREGWQIQDGLSALLAGRV